MSKFYFASAFLILLLNSCLTSQNIPTATIDYEETILDTLTVTAPRKSQEVFTIDKYNQEATKTYDLIHMVLSVEPSWETETVKGNATLFISPYFYPLDKIELDAVQMDIHSVKLFNSPCTLPIGIDLQKVRRVLMGEVVELGTSQKQDTSQAFAEVGTGDEQLGLTANELDQMMSAQVVSDLPDFIQ